MSGQVSKTQKTQTISLQQDLSPTFILARLHDSSRPAQLRSRSCNARPSPPPPYPPPPPSPPSPPPPPCPAGLDCSAAGSAPLQPGFWRPSPGLGAQRCPDATASCTADHCPSSACLGGSGLNGTCADGLTGPFCLLCEQSGMHHTRHSGRPATCEPCSESRSPVVAWWQAIYTESARGSSVSSHHNALLDPILGAFLPQPKPCMHLCLVSELIIQDIHAGSRHHGFTLRWRHCRS